MSVSIKFKDAIVHDGLYPITLEDSIRFCAAFAGIHDTLFQNDIHEGFATLADWTVDVADGTTWVVATGQLVVTGGGGGTWYQGIHDEEIGPSFVANFDLVSGSGAFVFRGKTGANDCYIAFWDATTCGFATIDNAKASTILISMPYAIGVASRVTVEVKWRLDSIDGTRKWLLMTMYVDGQPYAAYADDVGGTAFDWTGDEVGFAVFDGDVLTVDNLTISELRRTVEYITLDPGQPVAAGLTQAIGSTPLHWMVRFDGTLFAWLPSNRAVDWAVDANRDLGFMDKRVLTGTATHIRSIGALHSIDYFDDTEGQIHMHRFGQSDDPNLMNEEEVYRAAQRQVRDAKEAQAPIQLTVVGQPLIEAHDIITYDGTDYRVLSVGQAIKRAKRGIAFITRVEGRLYIAI